MADSYKALVVDQRDGETQSEIRTLSDTDLPPGEVTVRIDDSSLNYKDGLALTGAAPIIRKPPMTAGIDFAGTVESSDSDEFAPGQAVVLTGWGVGERHPGGFAQRARVEAAWLEALPEGCDTKWAMAVGTAGFTSMLCVMALERAGLKKGDGPVLVTGAAGGVGSVAVALLARLGYETVAISGRAECHDYLKGLGASEVLPRGERAEAPGKPLQKEHWAGAVDTVGGAMLAHVLTEMRYGSAVAACGLAGGAGLKTTVMPFILRGVNLLGIDSVMCPHEPRQAAWQRLAQDLPSDTLDAMTEVVPLDQASARGADIIKGAVRGRVVIDVNA
jgi:acrylyl-CoA reductase (NADPH)